MKKSIKILISLLLICTIMLPFGVRADTDYSIVTSPIQTGTTCVNPNGCTGQGGYTWNFPTTTTKGVRITITDEKGDKLTNSNTIDFLEDNLYTFGTPVYYNKNKTYKRDSYNSSGFFSSVGALKDTNHNDKKHTGTYIGSYFDLSLSSSLTCGSKLDWSCVSSYLIGLASDEKKLINFLKKFGVTYDDDKAKNWYFIVEPIVTMQYTSDGHNVVAWVIGTMTELENDLGKSPINVANNNYGHIGKKIMTYDKNVFSGNNLSSTFNWKNKNVGNKNVGLIWLGVNANSKKACPSGTEKSGEKLLPSTCNTACSTSGYDSNNCCDKACKLSEVSCSSFQNRSNTWTEGWVYNASKANEKLSANASTAIIRKTCGYQITCETDDIYNKSTNFKNVQLTSNTTRNCCLAFENKYANDKNKLNELYRDHNECYTCNYNEAQAQAVCSTNKNKTTAGYTFTRNIGNATVTADTYTCVSKSASGESKNTSTNLFAKKIVNDVCKVICSETVDLEFPFLNNGVSAKYVAKNSIFSWPKKNATSDDSLKLKVKGNLTCWYHVDLVKLYNLFSTNKTLANQKFNDCVNDMNKSLDNPSNILFQKYNLSGNYEVRYSDNGDNNGVALTKEANTNSVSYIKNTNAAKTTLAANQKNVKALVRYAESLKFTVSESANYVISDTGSNSGYIYSYGGKYYKNKIGISSVNENNILKIEPSLALNDKSGKGRVSIYYSNIGGTGTKFINSQKEYANSGLSDSYNNNRCTYIKTSDKTVECPSGTKNEGMNLSIIMTNESLSYEEAVKKYCNNDSDSGMTVCPNNSYYSGKPISKSCYDKAECRELTCNIHECTDSGGTCHILNSCMTRQIEDYGKTIEEAKKICTNKYCDGKPGNIEYRVIDLKDPFPGNKAESGSSLFNSNIQGRKPGSNWNSTTIVKKEILNNRGVKGDEVYNLTPLYEFNLTPSVIKKIREYNDEHSYDDFTLSCKGNNKQACVASGFDFRKNYGIVKAIEQCKEISGLDKFNSCYNNDSLR